MIKGEKNKVEILAPVGNNDMLKAALAAGSDAIYLACKDFGARAYAENFSRESLKDIVKELHLNNVKLYVTVNTAIKANEIKKVLDEICFLYEIGVDAIIVQDPGLIYIVHSIFPDLELHASTQLSVTSLAGALVLKNYGLKRVVMGRETSKEEAKLIAEKSGLDLEVFVHGSLCICVSGQCLLSSYQGGRSGNRGRCAQPCRKIYEPIRSNGQVLSDEKSYLSPADLYTAHRVNEYVYAGASSLKIEGRMKKPEYVYMAVKSYKRALEGKKYDSLGLMATTNRKFTEGFFFNKFGKEMANIADSNSALIAGKVETSKKGPFFIAELELFKGDQIILKGRKSDFPFTLVKDYRKADRVSLYDYPDIIIDSQVKLVHIARNRDNLNKDIKIFDARKLPLKISCVFKTGKFIELILSCGDIECKVRGEVVEIAKNQPINKTKLEKNLSKLGNSPFYLEKIESEISGEGFMPLASINAIRREGINKLIDKMTSIERVGPIFKALDRGIDKVFKSDILYYFPLYSMNQKKEVKEIFLMTKKPSREFSNYNLLDLVISDDIEVLKDWQERGIDVFLDIPMLMEMKEADNFFESLKKLDYKLKGFFLATINELGYLKKAIEMGIIAKDIEIIIGPGFQIFNSFALIPILKSLGNLKVRAFFHSTELVQKESADILASGLKFCLPIYGRLTAMILKHCPMSIIKGCKDKSNCENCSLSSDVFLRDSFGSRELIRKNFYSQLLNADLLDMRLNPEELLKNNYSSYLIIDRGEGEANQVISDIAKINISNVNEKENVKHSRYSDMLKIGEVTFKRKDRIEDRPIL